jgi:PEP-CTERM motif
MSSARRHYRRTRAGRRARRRPLLFAGGAALTVALTTALSLASFSGVDLAQAAVERAKSLAELMNRRSPGERTQGELIKTKHKAVAHERAIPKIQPAPPKNLVEALAPPAETPPTVEVPPFAQLVPPPTPPGVFVTPPPGVVVPPCCNIVPPPSPPPSPPPPPGVPEPGTWMTMILGFGLTGWMMRRRRPAQRVRSAS